MIIRVVSFEKEQDFLMGLIELQTTRMFYLWEKESLSRLKLFAGAAPQVLLSKPVPVAKPQLEIDVIG